MSAMSRQTGSATRVRVGGPFRLSKAFDEMNGTGGEIRAPYTAVADWFKGQKLEDLRKKQGDAEAAFRRTGITFAVYGDEEANRAADPLRHHPAHHFGCRVAPLSAGIEQRVRALNAFMYDIYHRQEIIKAGSVPEELIIQNQRLRARR